MPTPERFRQKITSTPDYAEVVVIDCEDNSSVAIEITSTQKNATAIAEELINFTKRILKNEES